MQRRVAEGGENGKNIRGTSTKATVSANQRRQKPRKRSGLFALKRHQS
jgi:hypothetical protein